MTAIYAKKSFRPGESIGSLVGRTRKAMIERIDADLAPLDISAAQWFVILLVGNGATATATELCKSMTYDPGAMTRLIDRLERKGVLKRVRASGDRRTVRIELTAGGKALYPKILGALVDTFNHLLRGFSKTEVSELEGYLKRMLANA